VIIIDNSPTSYMFQPENAFPSISWYDDPNDRELIDFVPLLEKLSVVKDVRQFLPLLVSDNKINLTKAKDVLNIGRLINPEDEERENLGNRLFTPHKAAKPPISDRYQISNTKEGGAQQRTHQATLITSSSQHSL
jgi:hypothetical protein